MKTYRPERCALCGKMRDHPIHEVPPSPTIIQRLMRLAWPSWVWGPGEGKHNWRDKSKRIEAAEMMAKLKQRIKRKRRTK